MDKKTITKEQADDTRYGDSEEFELITIEDIEKRRWYMAQFVVYKDEEGKLWGFNYDEPLTEYQEGGDTYEAIPVPVYPVVAKEVKQTIYEIVKQ